MYRIMPNAEHSCAGHYTTIILGIRAFYLSVLMVLFFNRVSMKLVHLLHIFFPQNKPRPKMTWKMETVSIINKNLAL